MKQIDYKLFFAIFGLIIFGAITISSVSVYPSHNITAKLVQAGKIPEAYNYFYVLRNLIHITIGLIIIGIFSKIPYKIYEKYFFKIIVGAYILLLSVFIPGIGTKIKGAIGWIDLKILPFFIQPTEFMKLALIIFLASFFKKYKNKLSDFNKGFLTFIQIMAIILIPIALQPDFGTILVIFPLSVIMFFLAGANIKHLGITFLVGLTILFGVYFGGKYDKAHPETRNKLSYITDRFDIFLQDNKKLFSERGKIKKDRNYQIKQALITIGSGGFSGVGFGKSIQKFGYLPEVQGDFIFSVIVEELGFVGALFLLSIFGYIGYRGFLIGFLSKDLFPKLIAYGITSWILLQAFINIGVNLNILPLTGITLPFVSYGGSSLLALAIGVGILLNISRDIDFSKSIFHMKMRNNYRKARVKIRSIR